MTLLKDESVKIMNEFDKFNRSAVMNLLTHQYSIPEYDADDILQDAWVLLLDKLMVGELPDVPNKLLALLMGFHIDNKSMRELADQLGYNSEDVAKNTKKRIIASLRTGIQQQERANGNGLSPVAFFQTEVKGFSFFYNYFLSRYVYLRFLLAYTYAGRCCI